MKPANKKPTNKTNQVRIIGGQLKRRQLSFIDTDGLRPTPDRLRETLFNWLMGNTQDAKVLDVCAGSGVLGVEAISRGAAHATFIEVNATQAKLLQSNLDTLNISTQCSVHQGQAQAILPTLNTAFDIIFIDPPYALDLWQILLELIIKYKCHHANTLIYLESDKPLDDIIASFSLNAHKSAKIGQVYAVLATFDRE
ncbi:MAG: 16S rRNA (guanine(966)-N(2))-methyltransferase RsmD [Moraxella sp.]|nr:16S rRNA (guanine(966)-N(2))-methyltransferase RsmD [Moraxella sp.]